MIEQMSLDDATAERARILGFRALSTADWQRVQRLSLHIAALLSETA